MPVKRSFVNFYCASVDGMGSFWKTEDLINLGSLCRSCIRAVAKVNVLLRTQLITYMVTV